MKITRRFSALFRVAQLSLTVVLMLCFAGCGDAGTGDSTGTGIGIGGSGGNPFVYEYDIGDTGPGGGIIIFRTEDGFIMTDNGQTCHYLEAAYIVHTPTAWASSSFSGTDIKNTETIIGAGRKNTALILQTDGTAPCAMLCDEFTRNGKMDWFLPSRAELNEVIKNRNLLGIPYGSNWSSSQDTHSMAWYFDDTSRSMKSGIKSILCNIFAVRAF